jgi:tetratricopeptide (TPR) repeat protein
MSSESPHNGQDLGEVTQPTDLSEFEATSPRLWPRLRWLLLAILLILVVASTAGYLAGKSQRETTRNAEIQKIIEEQFALGLIDLDESNYQLARQRFEYIIQLDPGFPEAGDRLAEALVNLSEPLPTQTPPALTPTPNLAPVQDILVQAQAAADESDWTRAIDTLLALRAKDPAYKAVEVDGLLFESLRNRGVERISRDQLLEEGMYDLSLAESFGPLDEGAENWRGWAQLYLTANSYFGLNWGQATLYFDLVYVVAPGIKHDVYWKYAYSAHQFGDQLVNAADPCAAIDQYQKSLAIQLNETLVPTATEAYNACLTATAPPPPPQATATPTPTDTPTPES